MQNFEPSISDLKGSFFAGGAADWRASREIFNSFIPDGATVLDAGCANGLLLESLLAWRTKPFVPFGFDIREDLIASARRRFERLNAGHFYVHDFFAPWPQHSYDVIIAPWASDVDVKLRFRLVQNATACANCTVLFYSYDDCLIDPVEMRVELVAAGLRVARECRRELRVTITEVVSPSASGAL